MDKTIVADSDENNMKRPYRKCLLERCENDVSDGRRDKKFCSDGHRNEYNNAIKIKEQQEISRINTALKKNRRIIKKLLGERGQTVVSEKKLLNAGFNFDFSTHTIVSKKKNNIFTFSYNYGYHNMNNGKFMIVKSFYGDAMPE
jgi:hypothetical protein